MSGPRWCFDTSCERSPREARRSSTARTSSKASRRSPRKPSCSTPAAWWPPPPTARLHDKFLDITASLLSMALMAAAQWDALGLDERDPAILGTLPVDTRDIGRAKLEALAMFVAAFAVLLNGVPSVLFPLLTLSHFHVNIIAVVRMIVVHAAVTMGAGAYAFVTILLLRELLRVLLGPRGFRRVAGLVQAALVVALGTTLLLLPAIASNVPAKWLRGGRVGPTAAPTWLLAAFGAGSRQAARHTLGLWP